MIFKAIVVGVFLLVLASLGYSLFGLFKGGTHSDKLLKGLTIRISLSVALFLFLMLAFSLGWIQPNTI